MPTLSENYDPVTLVSGYVNRARPGESYFAKGDAYRRLELLTHDGVLEYNGSVDYSQLTSEQRAIVGMTFNHKKTGARVVYRAEASEDSTPGSLSETVLIESSPRKVRRCVKALAPSFEEFLESA